MRRSLLISLLTAAVTTATVATPATAASTRDATRVQVLASGLEGALGSTIGPDGALYVVEGIAGRVTRIDRHTGER